MTNEESKEIAEKLAKEATDAGASGAIVIIAVNNQLGYFHSGGTGWAIDTLKILTEHLKAELK